MEIETKRASLDILAVTIQALHVNGKQMTLAVFKQLPVAMAYNVDGSLAQLEHWGIVRYSIKDEGDLWVVSVSGGRLYRCDLSWYGGSVYSSDMKLRRAKDMVLWWKKMKMAREKNAYAYLSPPRGAPKWSENGLGLLESDVEDCEELLAISRRAESTRAALSRLPQLFIAV